MIKLCGVFRHSGKVLDNEINEFGFSASTQSKPKERFVVKKPFNPIFLLLGEREKRFERTMRKLVTAWHHQYTT